METSTTNHNLNNGILDLIEADYLYSNPFPDFNEWFSTVIFEIRPTLIVGIARGALRLLQIQGINRFLDGIEVVSDHALPFIPDDKIKGKKILIFDDSVIYGSTLANVRDYLLKLGAIVHCASYAIDRFNFLGETDLSESHLLHSPSVYSTIPIQAKHKMWPKLLRQHHYTLVQAISQTPRDCNPDFPTFSIKLEDYATSEVPYLAHLLNKSGMIRGIVDVSTPISNINGIFRYTATLEQMRFPLFLGTDVYCRSFSKARITFVPELNELRLKPMPQLIMKDGTIFESIKAATPFLQSLWETLTPPYRNDDLFYQQALFRLATSFSALALGTAIVRQIESVTKAEFPVRQICLIEEDLAAIFGKTNAQSLKQVWANLKVSAFELKGSHSPSVPDELDYVNKTLLSLIKAEWRQRPSYKPQPGELPYEMLGKLLLTLRAVTDSEECRKNNPEVSRLEVGLSYEGILSLLKNECNIDLSRDNVSFAVDVCVDNGQAVPKVVRQNSVWLRAFYSGEPSDSQSLEQFKNSIHKGYSDFLKNRGSKPLSEFDMHKLCASLKEILPWLPIINTFNTFGRFVAVPRTGPREVKFIEWLVNRFQGPLKPTIIDGRKILLPNDSYEQNFKAAWSRNESRDFFDAFEYVATAFGKAKGNDGIKLLLSTCCTHRHTFNAVAFEAHSWVSGERGDFQQLLETLGSLTDGSTLLTVNQSIAENLYWCTRYISEAYKKYEIF